MRYEKLTTNVRSTTTVLNTGWISETFVFIFTIALEGNVNKICIRGRTLYHFARIILHLCLV